MFRAGGVIASVLFVAFEISENTRAVRGARIQAIAAQSSQYSAGLVQDSDWVRIMSLLSHDSVSAEALSAEDRVRLEWGLTAAARIMENRFRQSQPGIQQFEQVLDVGGGANQSLYRSRHFCEWWAISSPGTRFTDDFVAFMEGNILNCTNLAV